MLCLTPKLDASPKLLPLLFSFIASLVYLSIFTFNTFSLSGAPQMSQMRMEISSIPFFNRQSLSYSDSLPLLVYIVLSIPSVINSSGAYRILPSDLRMEVVVSTMRTTLSHHLLRDSLRLLTAAVKIAPVSAIIHQLFIYLRK